MPNIKSGIQKSGDHIFSSYFYQHSNTRYVLAAIPFIQISIKKGM